MDNPPSILDEEVFYFDEAFAEATSLTYSQINFLKFNILNLSDIWIPPRES